MMDATTKDRDLPEQLAEVVLKHGREMTALVYGAGMASEAVKVLAELSERSRNGAVLHAVKILAQTYNELSSSYARKHGWTEGELASCNTAIELAFSAKLVGADGRLL